MVYWYILYSAAADATDAAAEAATTMMGVGSSDLEGPTRSLSRGCRRGSRGRLGRRRLRWGGSVGRSHLGCKRRQVWGGGGSDGGRHGRGFLRDRRRLR